jgi:hypothetical protein
MSELSGRVRGVVNTPTPAGASGRWSVRAVNKYVGAGVWPPLSLGSFESIGTITVGGGGASSIEFTSYTGDVSAFAGAAYRAVIVNGCHRKQLRPNAKR